MPLDSIQEWRARIGSSWCALGRPMKSKSPHGTGRPKRCRSGGGKILSSCVQDHPVFVLTVLTTLLTGICNFSIGEFPPVDLFLGKCNAVYGVTFGVIDDDCCAGFFEQGQLNCCLFQWMAFFCAVVKTVLCSTSHAINVSVRCLIHNILLSLQLTMFFICQPFLIGISQVCFGDFV